MNFLSHYYFDRYSANADLIVGTVLPDLIKNANRNWNLHPEKRRALLGDDEGLLSVLEGWNRHITVDKYFHCSEFFMEHSRAIRNAIVPFLGNSPVRPSFLAHIALELMLDGLLITEGSINADEFYLQLRKADRPTLTKFLHLNELPESDTFFRFYDKFIELAYLKSYSEAQNLMYALNRICMRLWSDPLNEAQKQHLTEVLQTYQEKLRNSFMEIFKSITLTLQ